MAQRSRLLIAGFLTAFVLFLVGGVIASPALRKSAPQPGPAASTASNGISNDRALVLAIRLAPGSVPTRDAELVNFQGTLAYEVILNSGSIYLDAQTGAVLANTTAVQPVASTGAQPQPAGSLQPVRFDDTERRHVERGEERESRRTGSRHGGDDD